MKAFVFFLAGVLFAVGLVISGMTQPSKIIGFLDVTGAWDPSLAFVMLGAIGVHAPVVWWSRRRRRPLLSEAFEHPPRRHVDARLVGGAALFGVGWGLSGYCPGPALVALVALSPATLAFVGAMIVGALVERLLRRESTNVAEKATFVVLEPDS